MDVETRVAAVLIRLGREAVGVELAIKTAQLLAQAGPGFRVIVEGRDDAVPEVREDDDCAIPLGWYTVTNHGSALHREVEAALKALCVVSAEGPQTRAAMEPCARESTQ